MRILHCSDSFWPRTQGIGGVQVWLTHLANQQIAEGHAVGVMTWPWEGCAEQEAWNGIDVFRWPVSESELLGSAGKMRELVRASGTIGNSFRPDIIHVHINRLACWVQTMSPPTVPTVATMHVPAEHDGLPLKLRQRVFARANALVVPSKDLGQWLVERLPELQSKLRVVPHGMEEPTYPASSLRSDPFTFLCLGRLVPEKGFEVALRALAATGRRDLRLIIVGEGSAEPALRECAVQLKIAGQVEFRGWVHPDRVASLIDEATVVLMPSLWREPFGLVAVQAAQMGRPIIASRVGGIPEIVVDGVTGRLVAPGDPAALALVMTELVHDSLQLANLGAEASTWARQRFNIAECSRRYFSIYREQVSIPGGEADA